MTEPAIEETRANIAVSSRSAPVVPGRRFPVVGMANSRPEVKRKVALPVLEVVPPSACVLGRGTERGADLGPVVAGVSCCRHRLKVPTVDDFFDVVPVGDRNERICRRFKAIDVGCNRSAASLTGFKPSSSSSRVVAHRKYRLPPATSGSNSVCHLTLRACNAKIEHMEGRSWEDAREFGPEPVGAGVPGWICGWGVGDGVFRSAAERCAGTSTLTRKGLVMPPNVPFASLDVFEDLVGPTVAELLEIEAEAELLSAGVASIDAELAWLMRPCPATAARLLAALAVVVDLEVESAGVRCSGFGSSGCDGDDLVPWAEPVSVSSGGAGAVSSCVLGLESLCGVVGR